jgi:hypothetical protein
MGKARQMRKLFVLILVAAAGYSGYWFVGSSAAEKGGIAALDQLQADGLDISYDSLTTRGFPSRFDTTIENIDITDPATGLGWAAPFVQIFALSYQPNEIITVWPNTQTVKTRNQDVEVLTQDMRASVAFDPNTDLTLNRGTMEIDAAALLLGDTQELRFHRSLSSIRQAEGRTNGYDLYADVQRLNLPDDAAALLDPSGSLPRAIDLVKLDATVALDRPLDRHTSPVNKPQPTEINMRDVSITWGDMSVAMSGDLDLDTTGLPTGEVTLALRNWPAMVAALQSVGVLDLRSQKMLSATLSGMSGDGDGPVEVTVKMRSGAMSLGFIPLGRVPRIRF